MLSSPAPSVEPALNCCVDGVNKFDWGIESPGVAPNEGCRPPLNPSVCTFITGFCCRGREVGWDRGDGWGCTPGAATRLA